MPKRSSPFTTLRFVQVSIVIVCLILPLISHGAAVEITWNPSKPVVDGYRVFIRTEGEHYDYSKPSWIGPKPAAIIDSLEFNLRYYFVIRAFFGSLESPDSEEVSVKIYHSIPPKIERFKIISLASRNGTIYPSGTVSVPQGGAQRFIVTPANGYHVASVNVDGVSFGVLTNYMFENVQNDHTIYAFFSPDSIEPADPAYPGDDTELLPESTLSEVLEFGQIEIGNSWELVQFENEYFNPVVVAGPLQRNHGEPSIVRIRNVSSKGFQLRIQHWDEQDDSQMKEKVSYLVMEQGQYILEDGTLLEAMNLEQRFVYTLGDIQFKSRFTVAPVVSHTITSFNDSDAVTGRIHDVTNNGFKYLMQEQESNSQDHNTETLSYIAWEHSSGFLGDVKFIVDTAGSTIDHRYVSIFFDDPFIDDPSFLADMQTTHGIDTASVRYSNKDGFSVDVMIQEELSWDLETRHPPEVVGYMVFGR